MATFIARRFLQAIVILWGVSVIVFVLLRLAPSDPITIMLAETASPEQIAAARHQMGFDRPIYVQYVVFVDNALHGDLGESIFYQEPALQVIFNALPNTLLLGAFAFVFSVAVGVPVGILSALHRDTFWDYFGVGLALIGQATPPYWLGIMLIMLFSVGLHLLPSSGNFGPQYIILPAISLGAVLMPIVTRLVRSGMLDVLNEDYVRTARAKGLREQVVVWKHALRNMLIPLVTVLGLQVSALFGGAVIIEQVFGWPGVGQLAVNAIFSRDYPVVQADVLVVSSAFVFLNLLVDILYARLDPRIRYQ
ncbi:MAG TPA: ABC transporter permease [Chloroflexota bacterium]|nr:ABC transporter permease [Chloroflexota bacterium]